MQGATQGLRGNSTWYRSDVQESLFVELAPRYYVTIHFIRRFR